MFLKCSRWMLCSVVLLVAAVGALVSYNRTSRNGTAENETDPDDWAKLKQQVVKFCGDCHDCPEPATFPRDAWDGAVRLGFRLYEQSGRNDLVVPPIEDVIRFYVREAPEYLELSIPDSNVAYGKGRFRQRAVLHPDGPLKPTVSHIRWWTERMGGTGGILVCDMGSGEIANVTFEDRKPTVRRLLKLLHPAHVEPCDLDADGDVDLVVAELGSFKPGDHNLGQVVLARWDSTAQKYETISLQRGLGRVADVRPADVDGDGDLDLVVAEFGWRTGGSILLLENTGIEDAVPQFVTHLVDVRHGTIHVPVVDFNGDGHLDFFALISQQHEDVELFLNRGDGTFRPERVFSARNPAFGSTGIQIVDLDGDDDLDVLYTNGDIFDDFLLKPYHAVRWLENRGELPFEQHVVANMPGAYAAVAGDVDGDGDVDIAACSMTGLRDLPFNTLIWFEQTGPGTFARHNLEFSTDQHATLALGDFDGDGDLDLAVGDFEHSEVTHRSWFSVWWNEGRSTASTTEPTASEP